MSSLVLCVWAYIIMAGITAGCTITDRDPSTVLARTDVLALSIFWPWTFVVSIVIYLVRRAIRDR